MKTNWLKSIFKILTITFTLIIFGNQAYAEPESGAPKGKVKGTVLAERGKEILEYATVSLFESETNHLVTGSITDFMGHFKFDRPEEGSYYISISFMGLKDLKSEIFKVDDDNKNINLGFFYLKPGDQELGEVEVVAKRAAIEYRIDKKVVNVDKQITAEAGTAVDILENVPSIQVDIEGNVSLRGSGSFTVLIDGKPTILEPSDALRQIPSSNIENIEIITNPSVKYEPDGATGIINIVTKKNFFEGLSGIVNLNAGTYGQYGGDVQLSYRLHKFNFVFGANYNHRNRPGDVLSERTTISDDTTYFVNYDGTSNREFVRSSYKAGLEYNPTKNDFISVSGRFGQWDMTRGSELLYKNLTDPFTSESLYNSIDESKRGGSYYAVDGVYQHTFKKKVEENKTMGMKAQRGAKGSRVKMKPSGTHNIKFELNYRNRNSEEFTINQLNDLSGNLIGGQKNIENGPSQSWRLNLDYTLPLNKKDKFEAGFQSRIGLSKDVTELWLYNAETGEIVINPEFSNSIDYNRRIYAAYALYAGERGKFGYQLGLRSEYTDRKISMIGEDDFLLTRWDFFPTLHTSYSLVHDQQIMASYSRRINRPRGWQLEPFITWQDSYNVRQGNPALNPEYVDSFDAGYLIKFGDNFFSLEGYYRITNNKIERISSVYQENVMLSTFENVGHDYSLGTEAMLYIGITKWWEMSLSGNLYNYKVEGQLYGDDFSRTSTNWSSRFNNTFKIWKNAQLQLSSRYNSASVTAQGKSSGFYTVDAAFKMSFFQRNLTANIQGRDILGSSLREHTIEGLNFNTYYKYTPVSPMLTLSVSYKFNNFKLKREKVETGNDDDF